MKQPRFKFPKHTRSAQDLAEMREKLLSRSFYHAANDIQNIKAAIKTGRTYELPLTGLRPAKGFQARLADFADAAWNDYVAPLRGITKEQVTASKGYAAFHAYVYDHGISIDNLHTETVESKAKGGHTVAHIDMSWRPMRKNVPS